MIKDFEFELDITKSKANVKSGDRVVCGYASTFDVDSDNMQITRTALEKAKNDLLKYSTVLYNHERDYPIGKVVEVFVDDIGLFIKVVISKTEDDKWTKITEGIINKFSINGRTPDLASEEVSDGEIDRGVKQINNIEFYEVSLVTVPANVKAETICHYIAKSLRETKEDSNKNMKKEIKKDNENVEKSLGDMSEKLKIISGKLIGEDKEVIDYVLSVLKSKDVVKSPAYRLKGETKKECIARKLPELMKEGMTQEQAMAAAYSICEIDYTRKEINDSFENMITKMQKEDVSKEDITEVTEFLKEMKEYKIKPMMLKYDLDDESEDRPVFLLNSNDKLVPEKGTKNKFRKQILKKGKWFHWDAEGGVLNITSETIDNIIKNFKKKVIENVFVPLTHTNDPLKNSGEVVTLEKTDDGLDAIIEIKDESVAEKIKNGLIKSISASLDPNYRIKKTNKFSGPTLLHTALVAEPYIKGMKNFIALSEEFSERPVIQLEDEEPNFISLLKSLKDNIDNINKNMITPDKVNEIFVDLTKNKDNILQSEDEKEVKKDIKEEEEPKEDEKKEVKKDAEEKKEDVKKEEDKTDDEKKEDVEKDVELAKSAYTSCIGAQMKEGKSMAEASKFCKIKIKKDFNLPAEDELEVKSNEESVESDQQKVDFADAEKVYDKYLSKGKLVPAQKDSFIKLITSSNVLELSDNKVDVAKFFEDFMESQPKVLDFEEKGAQDSEKKNDVPEKKEETTEMPSEVKDFYEKMGLSDESAKESWEHAKGLQETEDKDKESTVF